MADFGKLNFAVSFNPQTAFPLDARYYFSTLGAAQAAAAADQVAADVARAVGEGPGEPTAQCAQVCPRIHQGGLVSGGTGVGDDHQG